MSGYAEIPWPGFGGLDLVSGRETVPPGQCVDVRNVVLGDGAAIRVRGGSQFHTSMLPQVPNGDPLIASQVHLGSHDYTVVAYENKVRAQQVGGAAADFSASVSRPSLQLVPLIGSDALFYAGGNGAALSKLVDGGAWTTHTVSIAGGAAGSAGTPSVLGLSSDGRLLLSGFAAGATGPGGATADPTMVYALQPYNPGALGSANDFFRVGAADDDGVVQIVTWRELTFVFTSRRFVVLTGISDLNGLPLFSRRPVDVGVGLVDKLAVTVAPEGVYFLGADGIYLTSGDAPKLISGGLGRRFFRGLTVTPFYTGPRLGPPQQTRLHYHQGSLYLTPRAAGGLLRYEIATGRWTVYTLPVEVPFTLRDGRLAFVDAQPGGAVNSAVWTFTDLVADPDFKSAPANHRVAAGYSAWWRSGLYSYEQVLSNIVQRKLWADDQNVQLKQVIATGGEVVVPLAAYFDGAGYALMGRYGYVSVWHQFRLFGDVSAGGVGGWSVHTLAHHLRGTRRTPLP